MITVDQAKQNGCTNGVQCGMG